MIAVNVKKSGGCLGIECRPQLLLALTGEEIVIPYAMAGFPVPIVKWLKRSDNGSRYKEVSDRSASRNSTHLLLSNVTRNDSGLYRVKIRNTVGSYTQNFKLQVTSNKDLMTICLTAKDVCSLLINGTSGHGSNKTISSKPTTPSPEWLPKDTRTTEKATSALATPTIQEMTYPEHVTFLSTTNNTFTLISEGPQGRGTTSKTRIHFAV